MYNNATLDEEVRLRAILGDVKDGTEDAGIIFQDEELDQAAGGESAHDNRFKPKT